MSEEGPPRASLGGDSNLFIAAVSSRRKPRRPLKPHIRSQRDERGPYDPHVLLGTQDMWRWASHDSAPHEYELPRHLTETRRSCNIATNKTRLDRDIARARRLTEHLTGTRSHHVAFQRRLERLLETPRHENLRNGDTLTLDMMVSARHHVASEFAFPLVYDEERVWARRVTNRARGHRGALRQTLTVVVDVPLTQAGRGEAAAQLNAIQRGLSSTATRALRPARGVTPHYTWRKHNAVEVNARFVLHVWFSGPLNELCYRAQLLEDQILRYFPDLSYVVISNALDDHVYTLLMDSVPECTWFWMRGGFPWKLSDEDFVDYLFAHAFAGRKRGHSARSGILSPTYYRRLHRYRRWPINLDEARQLRKTERGRARLVRFAHWAQHHRRWLVEQLGFAPILAIAEQVAGIS